MIGTKISDRYEIVGELGRGGMGVVYRARDPLLDREVAIKVVPPTLLTPETEVRFQREAQIVARMDHPAIVTVYDFGHHDGSIFFVMPVVSGSTLRTLLRDRSLVLGEVVDLGILVSDALAYSHNQGVVHRDIKPENLMVWRHGEGLRLRIMDFGLARVSIESQLTRITHSGTLIGTVCYFSPEQVSATHDLDARSDLYSLGVVLYEALVGEPPFSGEVQSVLYRIVHEHVTPPSLRGVDLDPELEQIVMRCLEREPSDRWASAAELVASLERYRAGLDEQERHRPVTQPSSRVTRSVVVPRAAAQMVGREVELGELQHRLNASVAGECQFVVVGGEAGIGKSRLLEELERLARARRIRVLHGRFVERDRAFAYQGFCEVIQEYYRRREASTSSSEVAELSDLASELVALFPVLSEVGPMRSGSVEERVGQDVRRRIEDRTAIFELLARVLARLGGGQPMVLLFEDLHDADVSIEALQYITRRLGPTPTLIVGTYRTSEVERGHALRRMIESLSGDRRFGQLVLGPLEVGEHRVLVEGLVGGGRVGEALGRALYAATEGNPFFTRELVRSLVDSGGIAEDETGVLALSSEMGLTSAQLPETIQQVVEKQVERLGEEEREVLARGALLGRTFEYRDLEALVGEKWDVEEAIERLVREGLLEEEREGRGERLTFASGVVRDVLYGGLSRRKRRTLHRRYAEYLEERYAGKLERLWGQLAHHYSQGDVGEKAVEYGLKAARKSVEAFSAEEAMRAAKTALEYLEDEEWGGERWQEGEARMLLARANRLEGNIDGALREVERAIKGFERDGDRPRAVKALLAAAEAAWDGRKIEETRRWVERGVEAAREVEDTETLSKLLSLGATVANLRSEYEVAREYLEEIERLRPRDEELREEVVEGGTLVVALPEEVRATEPAATSVVEEEEVLTNVFETLFTMDEKGTLLPHLCDRWEPCDRDRTFVFTLRRDIRFSDGHPLKAIDVKRSFERSVHFDPDVGHAALASIVGASVPLDREAQCDIGGIVVTSDYQFEIHLTEPLPIYPTMLSDSATGIARVVRREDGSEEVIGTGPFRIASWKSERILLERNERYWGRLPALEGIDFRVGLRPSDAAASFRAGTVDLVREFLPQDLERVLRDPRQRASIAEEPRRNSMFVLFNTSGPLTRHVEFRRALAGVVRSQDLIWQSLGRFALPATGLLPPDMLGHDPGRRRHVLPREQAMELIEQSGVPTPIRLRAAVSPILTERHGALIDNLFEVWADLGIDISVETWGRSAFARAVEESSGFDMIICGWNADYEDPDNFTFGAFHSRIGGFRAYFHSAETDQICELARGETEASVRETLYRKFENLLLEQAVIAPLFHEVDYRVANRRVRGLRLRCRAPFLNYGEVGKAAKTKAPSLPRRTSGGILHAPERLTEVETLDPALIATVNQGEVISNIFETLMRVADGARVVPWLAADYEVEEGGRRFRFRLRDDVRFHDGRRLTARDVRYSFERFLQNPNVLNRGLLTSIRGARDLIGGRVGDLEGFRILSTQEFTIELEAPVPIFPVMLTGAATAIVPEGSGRYDGSWRERCIGTGPFRVVQFDPGRRLELERNPDYWRAGYPKADGLVFTFGLTTEQVLAEFRAGRLSLATDLGPSEVDVLRHDSGYAPGYREVPRLATAYLAFNTRKAPLSDAVFRRRVALAINVGLLVRRTLGRFTLPAEGLIPPGFLGYEPNRRGTGPLPTTGRLDEPVELVAGVAGPYLDRYADFTNALLDAMRDFGILIRKVDTMMPSEFLEAQRENRLDLMVNTWAADYPDTDSFAYGLLHSVEGSIGTFCGSSELDRLIEQGRTEADPGARHFVYRQIEEILARDLPLLPLFHPRHYHFARPEVEGFSITSYTYPSVAYEKLWIK